ncbi:MAG: Wzt carbohydrate-binding domain-containing protein, partial [Solirubrobacteraceae bacterium]
LNFADARDPGEADGSGPDVAVVDGWLEDLGGTRRDDLEQGEGFRVNLLVEAHAHLPAPGIALELLNVDDVSVLGFGDSLERDDGSPTPMRAGDRLRVSAEIDRALVPGRYSVLCSMSRSREKGDSALRDLRVIEFLVKGRDPMPGMVMVRADVRAALETEAPAPRAEAPAR